MTRQIRRILLSLLTLAGCEPGSFRDARKEIAENMRDPASTQFRELRRGFGEMVCGEVNSKNAFGAYVGFRDFKWAPERGYEVAGDPDYLGQVYWAEACTPEGPERARMIAIAKQAEEAALASENAEEKEARIQFNVERAREALRVLRQPQ